MYNVCSVKVMLESNFEEVLGSGGALCSVLPTKYYLGDQVKKTEMSRACSTNGERRDVYRVFVGTLEERTPL